MNILISPLNWGIGHATRIVPIILRLKTKHNVFVAADGDSFYFLEQELNDYQIIKAPFLKIKYTKNKTLLPFKILFYIPRLFIFYIKNRLFLKKYINKYKINVIISDNRFGFFSKKVKSIFICHQINILMPKNFKIFTKIINKINRFNIEKFDECWIPDNEDNFSGKLSDSYKLKIPVYKSGLLSRFSDAKEISMVEKYEIICIVSGPEPQRSIFESKIKLLLKNTNFKTLILSGKPFSKNFYLEKNITIKNHISTNEFYSLLKHTKIIIARAGYSTIMDLLTIQKTAILVPTPGQTEQEYLAKYLHNKKLFFSIQQNKLFEENFIQFFTENIKTFEENIKKLKNTDLNSFLEKHITI